MHWDSIYKSITPYHVPLHCTVIHVVVSVHKILPPDGIGIAHTYMLCCNSTDIYVVHLKIILLQKHVWKDRSQHWCGKLLLGGSPAKILPHAASLQCETDLCSDGIGAWSLSIHSFSRAAHCRLCYFHAHYLWPDYCYFGDISWK